MSGLREAWERMPEREALQRVYEVMLERHRRVLGSYRETYGEGFVDFTGDVLQTAAIKLAEAGERGTLRSWARRVLLGVEEQDERKILGYLDKTLTRCAHEKRRREPRPGPEPDDLPAPATPGSDEEAGREEEARRKRLEQVLEVRHLMSTLGVTAVKAARPRRRVDHVEESLDQMWSLLRGQTTMGELVGAEEPSGGEDLKRRRDALYTRHKRARFDLHEWLDREEEAEAPALTRCQIGLARRILDTMRRRKPKGGSR